MFLSVFFFLLFRDFLYFAFNFLFSLFFGVTDRLLLFHFLPFCCILVSPMAEAGSRRRRDSASRTPCGRRRRSGVQPRPIYTEAELAALIFWVQRHLPAMLAAGGRPGSGYPLRQRRLLWGKVRRCVRGSTGSPRTTQQLKHRWADIVNREQDVLDLLGVEVEGFGSPSEPTTSWGVSVVKIEDMPDAQTTSEGASASQEAAWCVKEEVEAVEVGGVPAVAGTSATPTAGGPASRQKIAARLRSQRIEAIAAEYRKLMALEEQEEEEKARASSQPSSPPPSQSYQRQHRRLRRLQPGFTTASTQQYPTACASSTTDRLLRRVLHELALILLGQQNLAQEVADLHARLDAL
ncbi:uncharacterized protein LOC144780876 [Lissotriton helveticus]